jgi:TonB family protein
VNGDRATSPRRVQGLVDRIDRRLRDNPGIVRGALALLGIALLAVLGTAAWTVVMEYRAEHAIDPRPAYVKAVQDKIHDATQAALAGAQALQLPASVKVRIQIGPEGNLLSARVLLSSGDAGLDALTLQIVRSAAPFEPFSPEMRRTTRIVELNSDFQFR